MQRVANCILLADDRVLLLQKPRRGWWVAPGGKMEPGETTVETVIREYREETGLKLSRPRLCGMYTFCIEEKGRLYNEWMMFTFIANQYQGERLEKSEEGILAWHPVEKLAQLPTAPGDQLILKAALEGEFIIGRFVYTRDEELIDYTLHRNP